RFPGRATSILRVTKGDPPMTPFRVAVLCCALVLSLAGAASADEVDATLTCCHRHCGKKCYDPCEPVGPVRRFFRKVFLHPCPPPCPAPVGVVFVPPPPAPCGPSANLGRPVAPPAPTPDVAPVPAPFPSATSNRPQRLTPPTPPTPVRLD